MNGSFCEFHLDSADISKTISCKSNFKDGITFFFLACLLIGALATETFVIQNITKSLNIFQPKPYKISVKTNILSNIESSRR